MRRVLRAPTRVLKSAPISSTHPRHTTPSRSTCGASASFSSRCSQAVRIVALLAGRAAWADVTYRHAVGRADDAQLRVQAILGRHVLRRRAVEPVQPGRILCVCLSCANVFFSVTLTRDHPSADTEPPHRRAARPTHARCDKEPPLGNAVRLSVLHAPQLSSPAWRTG
jgi:hypothetical protein